ncbi:hypothetical protein ACO2Q2_17285 [Dyella sp. KRB-257]|uniref:hypothetical protein n=1 Tax=Dyella sp. KRB-257 TaxID=3400915 RepID=UPI003C090BA5
MDNKVAQVLQGFLQLTDAQKAEFQKELQGFSQGGDYTKRVFRESVNASVTKMQTGPHGGSCPCCGR